MAQNTAEALLKCRQELLAKMSTWKPIHMGAVPFVLCYGAAGALVQFYCVRPPPAATGDYTIHDVSDAINVNTPQGRLRLAIISINCFRVMMAMATAAPASGAHGFDDVVVQSGLRLKFAGDYVEKTYSLPSLVHDRS
jgi:hypothetical protein